MHLDLTIAGWLAVAALAGAAVGIEREWSGHASGPETRFAGVRTFLLLGTIGGIAGWCLGGDQKGAGVVILAATGALIVAAYVGALRRGSAHAVEATTEVAGLLVLALGAIAGLGFPLVTSGVTALMVLALAEKKAIHGLVRDLDEPELTAAFRFAVMALVVLPLLPSGPYGPYDSIRPRSIWTVVLIFSAINFAAYIAGKTLGRRRGYSVSGVLGGLISSTAVTLQFSRRSQEDEDAGVALALGVVGACTVLVLRVAAITTVLNPEIALAMVPYLAPMLVAGGVVFGLIFWRKHDGGTGDKESVVANPLRLRASLLMALAFQATLLGLGWVQQQLGDTGILATAAVLGFTDVDAMTYGMSRLVSGGAAVAMAARGITIGILSNTLLKLLIALILGRGRYRVVVLVSLLLMAAAAGAALWVGR